MYTRPQISTLISTIALMCAALSAQHGLGQTYERLPSVGSVAQLERLPSVQDGPPPYEQQPENRTVRFAGGSIELQVPRGWWAEEVPFGREVRLVLAPQRPASNRKMPVDGMWLAFHVADASESRSPEALSLELSERLRRAIGSNAQSPAPTYFQLGQWPAVVAEFTASASSTSNVSLTGRHVLVRTEWGVVELHASAPDSIVEARSTDWTTTWESLKLTAPMATHEAAPHTANVSNSIIGDWKAYRSQMRFSGDQRVAIVPDMVGPNGATTALTGSFEIRDDLIFVRWDDGSRLNFRWRMQGNDLFLTDHEGQISQLKRVFN